LIQISAKHRIIGAPVTAQLANLFPQAQRTPDNKMLLINHGIDETRLLRNLGLDVPGPIYGYDFEGGTPFAIQKKTADMFTMNRRAYCLNGMGTGKTKSALWAWRYLNRLGLAKKLLVVAPLSTLNFTWAKEIFQTLPGVKSQTLYGDKDRRLKRLADMEADVYIINHDGVNTIMNELMLRTDIDTVILDELAVYRNGQATRTKNIRKVVEKKKYVWGMTGSPTPNAPTDAWAQCTVVTPASVPKSFNRFRDATMTKITNFKYAPKPGALDTVFAVMQPAVRFTLDDVMELPELVERDVEVEMGPKQAKVYQEMERHAIAGIAGQEINAMNAGAVLNKLLQISCGYVYTRDHQTIPLDNDARLVALVDAVNATDRKVLVFVPFVHALKAVSERLTREGYDVRTVSGDTPRGERDSIFNLFQNTGMVKVVVAHPQCMAHGLTLTAADTIIWFAPMTNLEIFEQANARIRRIGQKHKQLVLMFSATKAEKKMYQKLRAKQKVQNLLLDLYAEATE